MDQTLLTTKLYFPTVRLSLVSRPRLVERLQNGLQGPLTLVSAPAGYGKTTLMSEWHAGIERDFPVTWLSLDEDDNDLSRFLMYLVTALGTLKAGISESVLAILQSPQPPPPQVTLTALINDLIDTLSTPFALVLDDYHVINSQLVHGAMTFLLDHLPPKMHIVILTRADPPLPLPSLRARNHLTELRAADLRFTPDEATAFLDTAMGLKLPVEDIAALAERTAGIPSKNIHT
jgi:LuxR family maltose regulon positive regulatory protein